uniref:Uncharacterized protein n=1 Tax=Oryza nivara TaxID=4536 RepID=A0A0E0HU97_ORYNI
MAKPSGWPKSSSHWPNLASQNSLANCGSHADSIPLPFSLSATVVVEMPLLQLKSSLPDAAAVGASAVTVIRRQPRSPSATVVSEVSPSGGGGGWGWGGDGGGEDQLSPAAS